MKKSEKSYRGNNVIEGVGVPKSMSLLPFPVCFCFERIPKLLHLSMLTHLRNGHTVLLVYDEVLCQNPDSRYQSRVHKGTYIQQKTFRVLLPCKTTS